MTGWIKPVRSLKCIQMSFSEQCAFNFVKIVIILSVYKKQYLLRTSSTFREKNPVQKMIKNIQRNEESPVPPKETNILLKFWMPLQYLLTLLKTLKEDLWIYGQNSRFHCLVTPFYLPHLTFWLKICNWSGDFPGREDAGVVYLWKCKKFPGIRTP